MATVQIGIQADAQMLDDPRDPPTPSGEPPVVEPEETPPTREEPANDDPASGEVPMIA